MHGATLRKPAVLVLSIVLCVIGACIVLGIYAVHEYRATQIENKKTLAAPMQRPVIKTDAPEPTVTPVYSWKKLMDDDQAEPAGTGTANMDT